MDLRPIPGDASAANVASMLDVRDAEWLLTAPGDYETGAVETMKDDGTNWQRLVALEWPTRVNNSDELRTVRLLISPEDAIGLAEVLAHTAVWLEAAARLGK